MRSDLGTSGQVRRADHPMGPVVDALQGRSMAYFMISGTWSEKRSSLWMRVLSTVSHRPGETIWYPGRQKHISQRFGSAALRCLRRWAVAGGLSISSADEVGGLWQRRRSQVRPNIP